MRVQQGRNPLTLTPDPAGSLLPPPGFPPPFFSYLSLPFGLFVLSPPPLPINSFLRSLTPPSGPSPYPKLPPLASSQNPNVAIAWGPLNRPGGLPSLSLGYSHAHLPGLRDLLKSRGAKGRDWDLGRLQLDWGGSSNTSPRQPGTQASTEASGTPPSLPHFPFSGFQTLGGRRKSQEVWGERTKCL